MWKRLPVMPAHTTETTLQRETSSDLKVSVDKLVVFLQGEGAIEGHPEVTVLAPVEVLLETADQLLQWDPHGLQTVTLQTVPLCATNQKKVFTL